MSRHITQDPRVSRRKLIGTVLMILLVLIYFPIALEVSTRLLIGMPIVVQIVGYMFAGMAWILPAGALISWMSKQPVSPASQPTAPPA
jgi:Protein of unknown function (DUF2842)